MNQNDPTRIVTLADELAAALEVAEGPIADAVVSALASALRRYVERREPLLVLDEEGLG